MINYDELFRTFTMNLSQVSQLVRIVLKSCLTQVTLIRFDTEVAVHVTLQTEGLSKPSGAASEGTLVALL